MPQTYPIIQHVEIGSKMLTPPLHSLTVSPKPPGKRETNTTCYQAAVASLTTNQLQESITHFRSILKADPRQPTVAFNLGVLYFLQEEFIPAYACFEITSQETPDDIQAIYQLGVIAFILRDYHTSLTHFLQAKKLTTLENLTHDQSIEMELYIGNNYLHLERHDKAIEQFAKATSAPSLSQHIAYQHLIQTYLHHLGNFEKAEQWIDEALSIDPQAIPHLISKTLVLKATGRLPQAFPHLILLKDVDPNNAEVYYNLACLHAASNEEASTKERLGIALRIDPALKASARHDIDFAHYFTIAWFVELTA